MRLSLDPITCILSEIAWRAYLHRMEAIETDERENAGDD